MIISAVACFAIYCRHPVSDSTKSTEDTVKQYTVTFDSQGGSSMAQQTVNHGDHATQPASPNRADCTFAGWYKDAAYVNQWDFKNDIVTGPVTLYAKWTTIGPSYDTTIKDSDGNVYTTIVIGNQVWTIENLRTTKYNDGTDIPLVTDDTEWTNLTSPGYCWYNNTTDVAEQKKWGALYNWYAVNTAKLAPAGWHVPRDAEWDTLQKFLKASGYTTGWLCDGTQSIAQSMAAKTDWSGASAVCAPGYNLSINNRSGFSALPGGFRNIWGKFNEINHEGRWWSATEDSTSYYLSSVSPNLNRFDSNNKMMGYNVRCVQD